MHAFHRIPVGTNCRYCDQPGTTESEVNVCGRCVILRNMMRLRPDASWRILYELMSAQ